MAGEDIRNALPRGHELDGYRIDRVLGAGGFGVTYLATEIEIKRRVAIKEYLPAGIAVRGRDDVSVHPLTSADKDNFEWGLDRFKKEAETLVAFRHPNIITVFRFFQANSTAYLVMAYEDGESLATLLDRDRTLSEAELREVLEPLLSGLEHVHAAGFLHRDIKPGNIYIRRDGSPVLLDFGAARLAMGGRSQSLTSIISAGYAPFEQYTTRGNQGPWSDIYALGGVLYRSSVGRRPPDAPDRIRNDPYEPAVEAARGEYDETFLAAIDAALRVDEEQRPQSVAEWRPMFEGESLPAPPEATLATGETATPTAPPPGMREESRTRWPGAAKPAVPRAAARSPIRRSILSSGRPDGERAGGTRWLVIGVAAAVLVAGAVGGGVLIVERDKTAEQRRQKTEEERRESTAREAVRAADAALGKGDLAEAERRLAEAEKLAPGLPELAAARVRLEDQRKRGLLDATARQFRELLDQAREAIGRRDFDGAERALDACARLADQHRIAEWQAEVKRLRETLAAARRGTGEIAPAGNWPGDAELRKAVEETIRKIAPGGL